MESKTETSQNSIEEEEINETFETNNLQVEITEEKHIKSDKITENSKVEIIKIQNIQRSLFKKSREFTIKTLPQNWIVKRSREDFKWLTKILDKEFPNKIIHQVGKGNLSKKTLEHFFINLIQDEEVRNCRFLKFFLTADSDKFKTQTKKSSSNWVSNLAEKFGNNDEAKIEDLKLLDPSNKNTLTTEENKTLNIFTDKMKDLQAKNTTAFNQIETILKEAVEKFKEFSKCMYKVADLFHSVNETYIKIEELCEGKFEGVEPHSGLYEKVKVGFYTFGDFLEKSSSNMEKCILPVINSIQKDSGHVHSLKHNLSSRHTKAFEKFKNNPSDENKKLKESLVEHVQALNLKIYEGFIDNYVGQSDRIRKAYYNYGLNQEAILSKSWKDWGKVKTFITGKVKDSS